MEGCSASTDSFSWGQLGRRSRATSTFRAYSRRSAEPQGRYVSTKAQSLGSIKSQAIEERPC